jgi:hypothetical protein
MMTPRSKVDRIVSTRWIREAPRVLLALPFVLGPTASAVPLDLFGMTIDCRDKSADGKPALILISDPDPGFETDPPGRVWLVDASTGKEKLHVAGSEPGDGFGFVTAFIDDIDSDGTCDFAVTCGMPSKPGQMQVRWYSGRDGHLLHARTIPVFGTLPALASIQDLDGDGKRDLLVGVSSSDKDHRAGSVRAISSKTFEPIYTVSGSKPDQCLGCVVQTIGDIDGDGVEDFAASSIPGYAPTFELSACHERACGSVSIISGKTGRVVREIPIPKEHGMFGTALAGGFDIDGDRVPDVVVTLTDLYDVSTVLGYSGATGKLIREWRSPHKRLPHADGPEYFGTACASSTDLQARTTWG